MLQTDKNLTNSRQRTVDRFGRGSQGYETTALVLLLGSLRVLLYANLRRTIPASELHRLRPGIKDPLESSAILPERR